MLRIRLGHHFPRLLVGHVIVGIAGALLLAACGSTSPTASPPSVTPQPTGELDSAAATAAIAGYMMDVAAGDFDGAWSRLSPGTQAAFGSKVEFAAERSAFMQSAGGRYRLATPTHDLALLAQWVSPEDPAGPPLARAFIAQVDYPALADNPAGFDILVAAPNPEGEWRIWKVR